MVADGGRERGLGHIHRATAIAVALATRSIATRCFAYGAAAPLERDGVRWEPFADRPGGLRCDVLVLDSYELAARDAGIETAKMIVLHDHVGPPADAALVVSAAGDPALTDERHLYGPAFACLRPAFWGLPQREPGPVRRVLVTTGGGDAAAAGELLAAAVREALHHVEVALVRGPLVNPLELEGVETLMMQESLAPELLRADLIVCAAGQTMLEAAATGAPTVAVSIVDNQRRQAERLAAAGAVRLLSAGDAAAVGAAARELAERDDERLLLSRHAQSAVDGYGALRVAAAVTRLMSSTDSMS